MLRAQAAALAGVNNQSARAELARINAQIAEAEEDLNDTILSHEYDMQNQGYDKLGEDAQKVLDDTLSSLERESEKADAIVNMMLDNSKSHWSEVYGKGGVIDNLMDHTGTAVSSMADQVLNVTEQTFKQVQEMAKVTVTFNVNADEVTKAVNDSKIQMGYGNASTAGSVANAEATVRGNNTQQTIQKEVDAKKEADAKAAAAKKAAEEAAAKKAEEERKKKAEEDAKKKAAEDAKKKAAEDAKKTSSSQNTGGKSSTGGTVTKQPTNAPASPSPSDAQFVKVDNKYLTDDNYKKFVALMNKQTKGSTAKSSDALTSLLYKGLAVSQLTSGTGTEIANLLGVKVSKTWTKEESNNVVNTLKASGWIERLQRDQKSSFDALIKKQKKGKATKNDDLTKYLNSKYGIAEMAQGTVTGNGGITSILGIPNSVNGAELVKILKLRGYKSGTSNIDEKELNWVHSGEIVYRKSDGAVLRPFNPGDKVFTKDMSDNLWKMAQIDPNAIRKMIESTDQTKFAPGKNTVSGSNVSTTTAPVINIHYDSMLTVNGNVDKDALPGLQEILKRSYEYTTRQMTREARKTGMR